MKIRNLALAGALLMVAAPAMAGPSTRAEREATRQLNLQAARDAQPLQSAPQMADAAAQLPDNAPPAAMPTTKVKMASPDAMPLSSLVNPPSRIANATLLDSSGKPAGAVQKVEIASDGKPTSLDVALIGAQEHLVTLDAASVRYDAAKNEILARATSDQLMAMPRG